MSFKFGFDVDLDDDAAVVDNVPAAVPALPTRPAGPSTEISLADLLSTLPEVISYSPLNCAGTPLLRRDLFDARFQLAMDEAGKESEYAKEEYIDAETDLIPGTYEGGLKSWEGGVDLVEVMRGVGDVAGWVRGGRVLEVGCGTGLPSAYLLGALLKSEGEGKTTLHLQDYNLPVLSLVTLPNLLLAAVPFLPEGLTRSVDTSAVEAGDEDGDGDEDEEETEDVARPFDAKLPGSLEVTTALIAAFTELLERAGVALRFTYGDWGGMARAIETEERYDLVLTAETIYAEDSMAALLDVLRVAAGARGEEGGRVEEKKKGEGEKEESLEASLGALDVRDWTKPRGGAEEAVVLVAAKVLYFGVGGGLDAFLAQVGALGGFSERVKEWVQGVGRAVVRVGW